MMTCKKVYLCNRAMALLSSLCPSEEAERGGAAAEGGGEAAERLSAGGAAPQAAAEGARDRREDAEKGGRTEATDG